MLNKEQVDSFLKKHKIKKKDVKEDLNIALYVACNFYILKKDILPMNITYIKALLVQIGYDKDIEYLSIKDINKAIEQLIASKKIIYDKENDVLKVNSKVLNKNTLELKVHCDGLVCYVSYNNKNYRVSSNNILLPGDIIEARVDDVLNIATEVSIIKHRELFVGTVMPEFSNNVKYKTVYSQDKELNNFNLIINKNCPFKIAIGDMAIFKIANIIKKDMSIIIEVEPISILKLDNVSDVVLKEVVSNDIKMDWPEQMKETLKKVPNKVRKSDLKGRVDLRDLNLVTIDGEDARDFDDAVYAKRNEQGFELYVAIADVSYYVKSMGVIDQEALKRTTSVYFPNFVIPMLPEALSNGICSLNPKEDRLCMVCKMQISKSGVLENYDFFPAVMNSKARFTYNLAYELIKNKKCKNHPGFDKFYDDLKTLYDLYKILKKQRINRGGINIEGKEVGFGFDENLNIIDIHPLVRNDAHMLIEECMIIANVAAASFVIKAKANSLFRVHAKPTEKKLDQFRAYLSRIGLDLPGGENPTPLDYLKLIKQSSKLPYASVVEEMMLRSFSKALYSPDNIGHFGLALSNYAHFTSPIRRYPDLQLHRTIKHILSKSDSKSYKSIVGAKAYTKKDLVALGKLCSEKELSADTAEFGVDNTLKCKYIADRYIGKELKGMISSVSNIGIFVSLVDFYIDGMIAWPNINCISFDVANQIVNLPKKKTLGIGDIVEVKVLDVQIESKKIHLVIKEYYKESSGKKTVKSKDSKKSKKAKVMSIADTLDKFVKLTSNLPRVNTVKK